MLYRDVFSNHYLQINISTNSKQIRTLIGNFLDLDNYSVARSRQIKINLSINETKNKASGIGGSILYYNKLERSNKLLSAMGNNVVAIEVDAKAATAKVQISHHDRIPKESLLNFILIRPLHFILMHRGFFFLHASAVSRGADCILLNGFQGSGKSTLALLLSQNGFSFFSDDDCFVKLEKRQARVFAFPTKIGLNNAFLKRCPEFRRFTLKKYRYGGKSRFSIRSIFPVPLDRNLRCKLILFLRYQPNSNMRIKRISEHNSLNKLAMTNKMDGYGTQELQKRFWTLCGLTKYARAYELIYNDDHLNEIPQIVSKLFLK